MPAARLEEHHSYVFDRPRVEAFERALAARVKPGAVVVDLGSGTGIFSALACRAGAARVYAIDSSPMLEMTRAICRDNGFADRVTFLRETSTRVTLPERVDVVIADQLGPLFGVGAGFPFVYDDARDRFLKPGGALVPQRVDLHLAPIESPERRATIDRWSSRPADLDYSAARAWALGTPEFARVARSELLSEGARGASIDLATGAPDPISLEATCTIARGGSLHGIAGWLVAELAPGITISTSPTDDSRIDRANVVFAMDDAIAVAPGDRVRAAIVMRPRDNIVGWSVTVEGDDGRVKGRTKHSTIDSLLLSIDDVVRTKPTFTPARTATADAKLTVLTLMDGRRSVADIERDVLRAHPRLFASASQAAALVAEVVRDAAR